MPDTPLKQQFIEAIRLTPEGINAFLETPIPTPPTIGTPADVDSAIIANGVAAKYILDLFNAYAGYTPIEGILRIGQHNSVQETAMLAGLEYITETEEVNDLEILAPESGATLKPGDVLLSAQAKNGTLIQCAVEITGLAPISLADTDGVFEGTITIEELGEYTATFTGLFEEEKTATATTTFTIDEEGDEPGGNDLKKAQDAFKKEYDRMGQLLSEQANRQTLAEQMAVVAKKARVVGGIQQQKGKVGISEHLGYLKQIIETLETLIADENSALNSIISNLGYLSSVVNRIAGL